MNSGSTDPLKVGIIGTGIGSVVHAPAFAESAFFEPVMIAGSQLDKTKKIAENLKLKYTTNWKEVIDNPEIEVVSIATPPAMHEEMVLYALEKGKNVISEKPLSTDADSALRMLEAAEDSGLPSMVNFEMR